MVLVMIYEGFELSEPHKFCFEMFIYVSMYMYSYVYTHSNFVASSLTMFSLLLITSYSFLTTRSEQLVIFENYIHIWSYLIQCYVKINIL